LARRSSLTSRPRASMRSRSSLVVPSRMPVSISCLRTHSCRVWGTHPILGAINSMAAHRDGYSPRCSCTMRTARSRTSGEHLFAFVIAQSSQRNEPLQNPGRFNSFRVDATWLRRAACSGQHRIAHPRHDGAGAVAQVAGVRHFLEVLGARQHDGQARGLVGAEL
jgi:hypothetical protein